MKRSAHSDTIIHQAQSQIIESLTDAIIVFDFNLRDLLANLEEMFRLPVDEKRITLRFGENLSSETATRITDEILSSSEKLATMLDAITKFLAL